MTIESMVVITGAEYEALRADVERLRRLGNDWLQQMADQRKEITRLTAEVERLNSELLQRDMTWLPAKDAEIERLTAEVRVWINHSKIAVWSDSEECKFLTAENERLRAALADAGRALDGAARKMKGNCSSGDVAAVMLAAGRTAEARAALKEDRT